MSKVDSLVERIDAEIERRSLLKHEFYRLWSEGKLTKNDLVGYSKEYYLLVRKVPDLVSNIIRGASSVGFEENLREEESHVELWERFASSLGISRAELQSYSGTLRTKAAVSKMEELTKLSSEEAFAAMYSYEREIPKISRTKVEGMKSYYGLDTNDAIAYFMVHERDDVKHANVWRNELSKIQDDEQKQKAYLAAVESLKAQNELLDAVMEANVGN